jgi:hypothetical protein
MAFENSAATDAKDLLQKLVIFLVANGWTSDRSAAEGLVGWTASLHKGAVYVHLRANLNEVVPFKNSTTDLGYSIALYVGSGFSGGSPFFSQLVGAPIQSSDAFAPRGAVMTLLVTAIGNYFFFSDATGDNIVVVVEKSSGIFAHMGWGTSLSKIGTWTGGPYFFASSSGQGGHSPSVGTTGHDLTASCMGIAGDDAAGCCTFVRAAVDAFDGWVSIGGSTIVGNPSFGYCGKLGASSVGGKGAGTDIRDQIPSYMQIGTFLSAGAFQSSLTSRMDGRANLLPCLLWALRDGSGAGYSPLGTIPNCFVCSGVGQGFAAKTDYAIGADTYTVFPNFAVKKTV